MFGGFRQFIDRIQNNSTISELKSKAQESISIIKHEIDHIIKTPSDCSVDIVSNDCHAGLGLILMYERKWDVLHRSHAAAAEKACTVDTLIKDIHDEVFKVERSIKSFHREMTQLSSLYVQLGTMEEQINSLAEDFVVVDEMIDQLDVTIQLQKVEERRAAKRYDLEQYRMRQSIELNELKKSINRDIDNIELNRANAELQVALERQNVYEEMFRNQMHEYEMYGTTEEITRSKISTYRRELSRLQKNDMQYDHTVNAESDTLRNIDITDIVAKDEDLALLDDFYNNNIDDDDDDSNEDSDEDEDGNDDDENPTNYDNSTDLNM